MSGGGVGVKVLSRVWARKTGGAAVGKGAAKQNARYLAQQTRLRAQKEANKVVAGAPRPKKSLGRVQLTDGLVPPAQRPIVRAAPARAQPVVAHQPPVVARQPPVVAQPPQSISTAAPARALPEAVTSVSSPAGVRGVWSRLGPGQRALAIGAGGLGVTALNQPPPMTDPRLLDALHAGVV